MCHSLVLKVILAAKNLISSAIFEAPTSFVYCLEFQDTRQLPRGWGNSGYPPMEFVAVIRCGRLNLFIMPPEDDAFEVLRKLQEKRRLAAKEALVQFVSKYSPATTKDADTFITTPEIIQAISQHTGWFFDAADIFELMTEMAYTSDTKNGMEFNWLLKT